MFRDPLVDAQGRSGWGGAVLTDAGRAAAGAVPVAYEDDFSQQAGATRLMRCKGKWLRDIPTEKKRLRRLAGEW